MIHDDNGDDDNDDHDDDEDDEDGGDDDGDDGEEEEEELLANWNEAFDQASLQDKCTNTAKILSVSVQTSGTRHHKLLSEWQLWHLRYLHPCWWRKSIPHVEKI